MHYTTELFNYLRTHPSVSVLTVNQRLSQFLLQHYHTNQHQLDSWLTPSILPYRAWLQQCFNQPLRPDQWCHYHLLSTVDEHLLWENMLSQYFSLSIEDAHTIAPLANQASQLLQQWHIPQSVYNTANMTEDQRLFSRWHRHIQQVIQQHQLISQSQLVDILIDRLQHANVSLPNEILLVGFNEQPPQLKQLIQILQHANCPVSFYKPVTKTAPCPIRALHCPDPQSEIDLMVRFALQEQQNHPDAFVGCIVPDLLQHRQLISDCFATYHNPQQQPGSAIVNISGGDPLINYPIIHCALLIIDLMAQPLEIKQWQYLLDSPYIDHYQQQYAARAELILRLQQQPHDRLPYKTMYALTTAMGLDLFKQLDPTALPNDSTPEDWCIRIRQWLKQCHWPGDRTLSSEEYQLAKRFYTLLDEYQHTAHFQSQLTLSEISRQLQKRCQTILFQPQSPPANIHVVGILEAAGLPFDNTWFAHCHADQFPLQATPHPFIPLSVQRQYHIPHCDSQHEFTFAQRIWDDLLHTVGHLYCSYSLYDGDSRQLPSPLLHDVDIVDATTLSSLNTIPTVTQKTATTSHYEIINDSTGIELSTTQLLGGTQLFKDYFACPARAYALHRLNAQEWPTRCNNGFNALQRGQLIHKALELAWRELKTQSALQQLSAQQQYQACLRWAQNAMAHLQRRSPLTTITSIIQIEQQRLHYLLDQWLTLERERPPFTIIDLETVTVLSLGECQLHVRLDRLDQLLDGSHCIIDYKTSPMRLDHWFGERIDEPQLPLYCIQPQLNHPGIAFACIRHDKLGFLSIVKDKQMLPGAVTFAELKKNAEIYTQSISSCDEAQPQVSSGVYTDIHEQRSKAATKSQLERQRVYSWQQQLQQWQQLFLEATKAIQNGNAIPDPKYGKQTCQYCHLQAICRYHTETI